MFRLIFNELSIQVQYGDKYTARQGMAKLVTTAFSAEGLGYCEGILTHEGMSISELCEGYSVADWALDKEVDADNRRYFLTKCQKAPYIEDLYKEGDQEVDYYWRSLKAIGLGVTHLRSGLALSLDSNHLFHPFIIPLDIVTLEASGNLSKSNCTVYNVCTSEQVQENKTNLRESLVNNISTGESLFRRMCTVFPSLSLCGDAIRQVQRLTGSEPYFNEIKRHFMVLNDTMDVCRGIFRPRTIDFAGRESKTTMQNTTCRNLRTFVCQDGKRREFLAHSKIHINSQRIHVVADTSTKIVHIGHVGDHLPLV